MAQCGASGNRLSTTRLLTCPTIPLAVLASSTIAASLGFGVFVAVRTWTRHRKHDGQVRKVAAADGVREGDKSTVGPVSGLVSLTSLRDFRVLDVLAESESSLSLLGRFSWQGLDQAGKEEQAIVNLSLTPSRLTGKAEQTLAAIKSRVAAIQLTLDIDSGAEYAYFRGVVAGVSLQYRAEVICPISAKQLARARGYAESKVMLKESFEVYRRVTEVHIQNVLAAKVETTDPDTGTSSLRSKHLAWLYNILEHKTEVDRVVLDSPGAPGQGFLLVINPKWTSHPDPATVPQSAWHSHTAIDNLFLLCLVYDRALRSVRDLRGTHLPLLRAMLSQSLACIHNTYGVRHDQVRVYVHYLPQFFHFHVHFARVDCVDGTEAGRALLLEDIIQWLEEDPDYFTRATLHLSLPQNHHLVVGM